VWVFAPTRFALPPFRLFLMETDMRTLLEKELELVAGAGRCHCDCHPRRKGNNGWGNGAEGTNPGSDEGGTAGSKSDESWEPGDGPRPGKFDER
jgi:hypothetical protein